MEEVWLVTACDPHLVLTRVVIDCFCDSNLTSSSGEAGEVHFFNYPDQVLGSAGMCLVYLCDMSLGGVKMK